MAAQSFRLGGPDELGDRIDEAESACRSDPDNRDGWTRLTDLLGEAARWSAVVDVSRQCAARFTDWAEPWFRLSVASEELGDIPESLQAAAEAVERDPSHIGAQAQLGLRRVEVGERLDGMERLMSATQLSPHPFVLLRRAKAHLLCDQPEAAQYWLDRLAEAAPDSEGGITLQAHLLEQTGRLDAAATALSALPERRGASLLIEATVLRRTGQPATALRLLSPANPATATLAPGLAELERARDLALLDQVDDAWAEFSAANRLARSRSTFGDEVLGWYDRVTEWWTRQPPDRPRPIAPAPPRTPLAFLVGLPRSGTTVVEQIIVKSGVISSTECTAMARAVTELATMSNVDYPAVLDHIEGPGLDVLHAAYWEVLARWLVPDDGPVLDKLPLNLLYLAAVDAAFPETRVVMLRRDPRDVVLSLYQQQFVDNPSMVLTTDLSTTTALYVGAMRLWTEARSRLRVPVLEVRYEHLVAHPGPVLDRLGDFLGRELAVPQAPDSSRPRLIATPSYDAADGPIHDRSIGRWKRYERHLEPVLDQLEPWVVAHEATGEPG